MPASHLGRRRSRPVADAPALDGAELAKAWLVELVALAPLERAARLPGPRFADDAPRLCAAILAALSSDTALDDLEPGGTLAPLAAGAGHLAASPGPHEAVAALDALRGVAWVALLDAADRPVPAQIADLADRLAAVIAAVTTAALDPPHPLGPTRPGDRGPLAAVLREAREGGSEPGDPHAETDPAPEAEAEAEGEAAPPEAGPEAAPPAAADETDPPAAAPPPFGARAGDAADPPADVLDTGAAEDEVRRNSAAAFRRFTSDPDERLADRPSLRAVAPGEPVPPAQQTPAAEALRQIEETLRDAAHAADPLAEAAARLRALAQTAEGPAGDPFDAAATRLRAIVPPAAEPRIRRMPVVEDGTDLAGARETPWAASIDRRLARHRADALPFAVLCLEITDAERLLAGNADREVVELFERAEAAVLGQLRPADALIRERPGRYWLTTPDTDASDARALAHRIAGAISEVPPHRGVPLQAAVGVTTCPVDGSTAPILEARAEEGLFTARAAGLRVAGPSH